MHGVLSVSLSANFFNHTLRPLDNPGTKKATVCSRCHSSTVLLCLYFRFILPPQKNPLGTIGTIGNDYRSDWNKRFLFFIWEEGKHCRKSEGRLLRRLTIHVIKYVFIVYRGPEYEQAVCLCHVLLSFLALIS